MKFKILSVSLMMLSPIVFAQQTNVSEYPFIKKVNLSKFPIKERIKYHKLFTKTVVSLSHSEKYPKYLLKRKVSSHHLYNYLTDLLLDSSIANTSSNVCLFGGWPSNKSGTCQVPFQSSGVAIANQIGISAYDQDDYCGSSNLFRCNPDIFGPGVESTPEITEKFGNINGNKNNSDPYSAGICVDVSQGYNSLTTDCAKTSKDLDQYRDKPWRDDYFASNDQENFQKMQSTISTICEERAARRQSDPMCENLEESLGLTFAAVSAGAIADVNIEDLFPGCGGVVPNALPTCASEDHESLKNLRAALEEVQSNQSCRFMNVSAEIAPDKPIIGRHGRSNLYGDLPEPVAPESSNQCRTFLATTLQSGLSGDTNINVFFKGTAVDDLNYISLKVHPNMSKEEIVAQITGGTNEDMFNNTCAVSTCPNSNSQGSAVLYDVMEHLRSKRDCHFQNIQVVDQKTNIDGNFEKSQCQQSIEGSLAAEGLGENDQEIMFIVTDAAGNLNTGALIVNANQSSTKDDILNQFEEGNNQGVYASACQRTTNDFRTNIGLARTELGLEEDQYIDPSQEALLVKLANLKRNGTEVEFIIAPNGDIMAKPRVAVINETTGMQFHMNPEDFVVFPASFSAQMKHFESQVGSPIPENVASIMTDLAGDLRLSEFKEENGAYSFTVGNARANLLESDKSIQDGQLVRASENEDGTYTYSIAQATHTDQIEIKREAEQEVAREIASNTVERRVCAERGPKGRCDRWELRPMYCAQKGFLGFGCREWVPVQ